MVGTITRSNHPSAYWPGMHKFFGQSYDRKNQFWSQIFDVRKSKKAHEEIGELSGFGLAVAKPEGEAIHFDSQLEGPKSYFMHVAYALGFIITREAQEDNLYKEVGEMRSRALGFSMRQTKEIVHHEILNGAFDPLVPGADGEPLVSTSHPIHGGTLSNQVAIPADLSEVALEDAMTQVGLLRDRRGHFVSVQAKTLIIHPAQVFEATRILRSVLQSNTDGNNVNAIRSLGMVPDIVSTPFLHDKDAFFLKTNAPEGLISFARTPLEYRNDNHFDTHNKRFQAYERYSTGFGDWRAIVGSPGA